MRSCTNFIFGLNYLLGICRQRVARVIAAIAAGGLFVCSFGNTPVMQAQSPRENSTRPSSFEFASVKIHQSPESRYSVLFPAGRFNATGAPTELLIEIAYDVMGFQIAAAPTWISSERYDIDEKIDDLSDQAQIPPEVREIRRRQVIQSLLADRFKLKVSHETKDLPVYALVVAKNGPKLTPTTATPTGSDNTNPERPQRVPLMRLTTGQLIMTGAPLAKLVRQLSRQFGRPVLDQTGLKGNFDLTLTWQPESQGQMSNSQTHTNVSEADSCESSICTAIQEQLGLKLESRTAPVDIITIEHIEKPSVNKRGGSPRMPGSPANMLFV